MGDGSSLLGDQDRLERILTYYFRFKEIMLGNEELDGELKTNIQLFNELRSCLDHLMQCLAFSAPKELRKSLPQSCGAGEIKPEDRVLAAQSQIDSAVKHLERALFDACDTASILYRQKIGVLQSYHSSDVRSVLPEYYSVICPETNRCVTTISQLRNGRSGFDGDKMMDVEHYVNTVSTLKGYAQQVGDAQAKLIQEGVPRYGETFSSPRKSQLFVFLLGALIGACVLFIVLGVAGAGLLEAAGNFVDNLFGLLS